MKELTIAPRAGKRYLKLLENAIGGSLPVSLNEVILKYAGLRVLEDTYEDKSKVLWEIQSFDNVASMVVLTKEFIVKGWGKKLPFAFDPGGWHYCLSFDEDTYGKVIVNRWTDHEDKDQFLVIAESFEEFIEGLKRSPQENT
jgi:hypothetical protein